MVKKTSEFELKSVRQDSQGRSILLEAIVQDQKFSFLNIYAPNKTSEQILFFNQIKDELNRMGIDDECRIIAGGEFNVILDPKLDGHGGNPKLKESGKLIENICLTHDLVGIWRVRNPTLKRFMWSPKKPSGAKEA